MGNITSQKIDDKKVWESFILKKNPESFLHSWNWGEVQRQVGKKIFRQGYYEENKLIGASLFIEEDAKRGKHFVVPGGPIIDWNNKTLVSKWKESLTNLSKENHAWFVRVRPELLNTEENRLMLMKLGFISSPMHLHSENTWLLNIESGEDELLMGMRKNTRYMVKKALKSKLKVERSKDFESVNILYKLQKQTVKRHGFVGFSKRLFYAQIENFGNDNQSNIYLIKKGREVLVAAIIIFYGDCAYYHHSASSENSRNYPASYLLQWQVIKDAKKRGLKNYNFWGIAPYNRESNHRFSGVTTFKKGFGGKRVDWLHAMDYPVSKKYFLTSMFEKLRKKKRNL